MTPGAPTGGERRLTVLVDALACKPRQSGILSHGVGVVRGLVAVDGLRVVVLTGSPEEFAAAAGGSEMVVAPVRTRSFVARAAWRDVRLPGIIRSCRADVLLSTVPELPLRRTRIPSVMVVHDVAAVVAPALYGAPKRLRYELLLRGSLRRASHVVCVSQATLLDLHRWSGVPAGKCTVIGNAPQPLGRGAGVRPFDRPYLLMVGDLYGNKNTRTVLEALADLRDRGAAVSHLIIVGPLPKSTAARLGRDCEELGITGHVHHRGFVGAGALADLYRGAVALIYPSLYEGQGIPVMEAEMCGAAVIATDLPSLREFAGAGVTFVGRPLDPAAWTAAILQRLGGPRRPAEAARPYEDWRDVGRRLAGTLRAAANGAAAAPS